MFRDGALADVSLRMHYPAAPQVMRSVADGTADLGFVHCPQPAGSLACEAITDEELVLVAPAGASASLLEHLPAQSFVTYDESDYVFATWFAQVNGTTTPILRCTAHFEELEEVLEWVADGRGLSIVPADCAAAAVADGKLALLRWPGRRCSNAIYGVRDPAVTLPSAAQTLLHLLQTRDGMALSVA
jgi:DNA-binding transcriptional LysR family regulator